MTNIQFRIETIEEFLADRIAASKACQLLGLHRVSFWRLVKKYESGGRRGLKHGLRGRRSNNAKPEPLKTLIRSWYKSECDLMGRSVLSFYGDVKAMLPQNLSYATVLSWVRPAST